MMITRTSEISRKVREKDIPVTEAQLEAWYAGANIQEVMPELTADEREFLITDITAEEWAEYFEEESGP